MKTILDLTPKDGKRIVLSLKRGIRPYNVSIITHFEIIDGSFSINWGGYPVWGIQCMDKNNHNLDRFLISFQEEEVKQWLNANDFIIPDIKDYTIVTQTQSKSS